MTRRARRNHSPALKAKVALAAIRGEKTMSEPRPAVRRASEPDQAVEGATAGKRARGLRRRGEEGGRIGDATCTAFHAKIGQLTLENDFLEGALSKAGLWPSARR